MMLPAGKSPAQRTGKCVNWDPGQALSSLAVCSMAVNRSMVVKGGAGTAPGFADPSISLPPGLSGHDSQVGGPGFQEHPGLAWHLLVSENEKSIHWLQSCGTGRTKDG